MKEQSHGKVSRVPGPPPPCAPSPPSPAGLGCALGRRCSHPSPAPVGSCCPRPDLAAVCRECTREAPLWNQAIPSKLLAEAAWLCWPGGHLPAPPTPHSSFCSFSLGLDTCCPWGCPLMSLQVPVPHSLARSDTHRETMTHTQ